MLKRDEQTTLWRLIGLFWVLSLFWVACQHEGDSVSMSDAERFHLDSLIRSCKELAPLDPPLNEYLTSHNEYGYVLAQKQIGKYYRHKGDFLKALEHQQEGTRKAAEENAKAYAWMGDKADRWHWLKACVALGRVYTGKRDWVNAETYTKSALDLAKCLQSLRHLAEIYPILY